MEYDLRNLWSFQKKFFFKKKTFLWTRRMPFWQPIRKILDQKSTDVWLYVRNRLEKNLFLWKKFYLLKRSSGLKESSCDRPSEMFLLEVRNQQIRSSNLTKSFLKMFFPTRKVHFSERSRKFSVNVRAFFAQSLEKKGFHLFKFLSLEKILRTSRRQNWQPWGSFFNRTLNRFNSKSESEK